MPAKKRKGSKKAPPDMLRPNPTTEENDHDLLGGPSDDDQIFDSVRSEMAIQPERILTGNPALGHPARGPGWERLSQDSGSACPGLTFPTLVPWPGVLGLDFPLVYVRAV